MLVASTASLVSVSSIFPPVAVVVTGSFVPAMVPTVLAVVVVAESLVGQETAAGVVSA